MSATDFVKAKARSHYVSARMEFLVYVDMEKPIEVFTSSISEEYPFPRAVQGQTLQGFGRFGPGTAVDK
jgi:hypothetical protein